MIYLLFILSYGVYSEFIHTKQGVYSNIDIEFDETDPIASHPDMMSYVNEIYERNIRRGLNNPAELETIDRQVILDLHNKIRSETARGLYEGPGGSYQPQACNMNALSWSIVLEELSTQWSSQCYFEHSTNCVTRMGNVINNNQLTAEWNRQSTDPCGENLYISGASPALNAVYNNKNYGICGGIETGWSKEESLKYTYAKKYNYAAGHYTQVVWANTRYVGCGFRQCNGISTKSSTYTWGKLMFTCNYYPPGNYNNQYPYKTGQPCSCCDIDRKVCTHDNGLCGGGWNSNFNVDSISEKSTVDRCYDGTGRNVCIDTSIATNKPSIGPTPAPTPLPSKKPTIAPTLQRIENPTVSPNSENNNDDLRYAIRVLSEIIWLTYSYDYDNIGASIEELMFETLAEKYLGLTSASVDEYASSVRGPFCANPCYYIYGFNTVPMVLQGVTELQKDNIVSMVNDGSYANNLCDALTNRYKNENNRGLKCYRVTANVESITESEYQKFIGDLDENGIPFDTFNLESYSGADIFVLLIFVSFICCICWCIGWYSHKKKFQKELEKELNLASMYNPQIHQRELRKQMAANQSPDLFQKGIGRIYTNKT